MQFVEHCGNLDVLLYVLHSILGGCNIEDIGIQSDVQFDNAICVNFTWWAQDTNSGHRGEKPMH